MPVRPGVPGSKSETHRALVCAALAEGESELVGAGICDDTERTAAGLAAFGAGIEWAGEGIRVRGIGGGNSVAPVRIDCGESGTTLRFLAAVAARFSRKTTFDGTGRLPVRPMGPLLDALTSLGASTRPAGDDRVLPLVVRGPLRGGIVAVDGSASSQFLSALLLVAPGLPKGIEVAATGRTISRPYVDLTVTTMEAFGGGVDRPAGGGWRVAHGGGYRGRRFEVEPDASAASYWIAAVLLTGRDAILPAALAGVRQGDRVMLDRVGEIGGRVEPDAEGIRVAGRFVGGIDWNLADTPDLAPTLAALALASPRPTRLRGLAHLAGKESDRPTTLAREAARLGGQVRRTGDLLEIAGPERLVPATVRTDGDHRIAMAFAVLSLLEPGIAVDDPGCVSKSFPAFWEGLARFREGDV